MASSPGGETLLDAPLLDEEAPLRDEEAPLLEPSHRANGARSAPGIRVRGGLGERWAGRGRKRGEPGSGKKGDPSQTRT